MLFDKTLDFKGDPLLTTDKRSCITLCELNTETRGVCIRFISANQLFPRAPLICSDSLSPTENAFSATKTKGTSLHTS